MKKFSILLSAIALSSMINAKEFINIGTEEI